MAKRENQGLQIAVILLTMSTLLFLILSVIFWKASDTRLKEATAAKENASKSDEAARKSSEENLELKKWLGYDEAETQDTIRADVEKSLSALGPNFAPEQRNFKQLPKFLIETILAKNAELSNAANLEKELRKERDDAVAQQKELKELTEAAYKKATDEYLEQRKTLEGQSAKQRVEADKALAESRKTQETLAKKNAELTEELKRIQTELAALGEKTDLLNLQISQYEKESFDRPNGRVTWVNQGLRTVYINLGSEDALRPQATFSIFDSNTTNLARVEKKGSIEVTRILGEHLAEAQVLDDRANNPIVVGDVIYSPIFQKGRPVHFALAGLIDVDRDGQDDRELVRNLISISGGVIDAEVAPDGKRTGNVTIDTRYLVVGERPKSGNNVEAAAEAMEKIQSECDLAGVAQISLDRFLSDIGYQHATRTVGLGANAKGDDFRLDRRNEKKFQLRPAARRSPQESKVAPDKKE
jgi:hypothetical protein